MPTIANTTSSFIVRKSAIATAGTRQGGMAAAQRVLCNVSAFSSFCVNHGLGVAPEELCRTACAATAEAAKERAAALAAGTGTTAGREG